MRERNIAIFETYAEALMDAAIHQDSLDATFDEATAVRQILSQHPELLRLLEKPAILKEEKQELLRRAFEGRLSPLMLNLSLLLVDKHRGGQWDGILEFFVKKVEESRGIHQGQVHTAHEVSEEEKRRLRDALESFTGKKLRMDFRRETDLVGGVLFRSGDTMIDGTVRGFLKELRARLLGVKIEIENGNEKAS